MKIYDVSSPSWMMKQELKKMGYADSQIELLTDMAEDFFGGPYEKKIKFLKYQLDEAYKQLDEANYYGER